MAAAFAGSFVGVHCANASGLKHEAAAHRRGHVLGLRAAIMIDWYARHRITGSMSRRHGSWVRTVSKAPGTAQCPLTSHLRR